MEILACYSKKTKQDRGFINEVSINSNNYVNGLDLSASPDSGFGLVQGKSEIRLLLPDVLLIIFHKILLWFPDNV